MLLNEELGHHLLAMTLHSDRYFQGAASVFLEHKRKDFLEMQVAAASPFSTRASARLVQHELSQGTKFLVYSPV